MRKDSKKNEVVVSILVGKYYCLAMGTTKELGNH